jgi:cell wall-associated NlpC family hydrolase
VSVTDATFAAPIRRRALRAVRWPRRAQIQVPASWIGLARGLRAYRPAPAAIVVIMLVGLLTTTTSVAVVLHSSMATAATGTTAANAGLAEAVPAGSSTGQVVPAQVPTTAAPTPSAVPYPAFAPVRHLVVPTLLVSAAKPISASAIKAISRVPGVHRTQTLLAGRVSIAGHRAFTVGADPRTIRRWTPAVTADSAPLWDSDEAGDLITSFDLGENAKLPLGGDQSVQSRVGVTPLRLGALASIGMAGVDAVVSATQAGALGLQPHTGLLINAPKADPLALRRAVLARLGGRGQVSVLNETVVTRDVGEFLTRAQIANFLAAADSRVGLPYVWGAEGPNAFDCSGLVQWSFARIGIRMPRVAQDQFFTGPHIPYADALPGDLLFWHYEPNDPTYVSHVAIYVGDGEMLVAPHTGVNVQLAPVPLPDMAGVVRVDPAVAAHVA